MNFNLKKILDTNSKLIEECKSISNDLWTTGENLFNLCWRESLFEKRIIYLNENAKKTDDIKTELIEYLKVLKFFKEELVFLWTFVENKKTLKAIQKSIKFVEETGRNILTEKKKLMWTTLS